MHMEGDGPEGQPAETVVTLESLAEGMDEETVVDEPDSEETGESEEVESEDAEAEESEDAEDSQEEAKLKFTIKHDGKDVDLELTPEEHAAMLQQSFDYTKKTMALAEERKAIAPLREQAEQARKQAEDVLNESAARLTAYKQFMESQVGQPPPISLAQQDAARYLAEKELYEARKGQLHQVDAEIRRLQEDHARSRQAWINQKAESAEKALKDTLPGWNEALLTDYAGYAKDLGLTTESAQFAMLEPGFWQLVHKAKAYDALQAEKAKLKPVSQLPKVHKPSGNPQPPQLAQRQEAIKRHKARPSIDTLADLL